MKFIPVPSEQPSSLIKPPFFWQACDVGRKEYHLYLENQKVASLLLKDERGKPALMQLGHKTYEFRDKSSFFAPCLLLLEKESGKRAGNIERNSLNPGEGWIRLQGQVYGWKFRNQADTCLLLMNQQRKRLLSYHYGPGYVRLLLNKGGQDDEHLISLLCICLYLLPIWHSSQSPALRPHQEQKEVHY